MKKSTIKILLLAFISSFTMQSNGQEIKTKQDAINFLNWSVPNFTIIENTIDLNGAEKNIRYKCTGFSLENQYLVLIAGGKNILLDLTVNCVLNNKNYEDDSTSIYSIHLSYKNYKIKYRVDDFAPYGYANKKKNKDIKSEFLQRLEEFYLSYKILQTNLDSNEKADLKLLKFKDESTKNGYSYEISEEQRKYIVQANAANDAKDYTNALLLYSKALDINNFSYPNAYFNMSLILSQTRHYYQAVYAMKKYLILSPNSEDARKAQDKIYEWELNIKN